MKARRAVLGLGVLGVLFVALSLGACKKSEQAKGDAGRDAPAELAKGNGARARPAEPERAFPTEPCDYAMVVAERLDIYRGVARPLDPMLPKAVLRREEYGLRALDWLAEADRRLGRVSNGRAEDVALIDEVLGRMSEHEQDAMRNDLALIVTQMRAVALLEMRRLLGEVADGRVIGDQAVAAWDEARCLWDGGLRKLAQRADALPERGGEGWEGSIAEAFDAGREALDGGDSLAPKVAKQQIEKGMYAVAHRLLLADAEARTAAEASEALGLLDALEDRLADRNGPGLRRMRRMLAGDPAAIDAAVIERELDVAFSKRARKYCDKAVSSGELGSPDAVAETWEGVIYTRVILPGMRETLGDAGFDADAYVADWQRYLEAVEGGDAAAAAEVSPRLVEWNCAYQDRLGIAACTSSEDEPEASPLPD